MTVTAGTVEEPGFGGSLISKFFNFLAGSGTQRAKTFRLPDYQNATTTTAAETGQAIDLTDEGAVFLADHLYKVTFRSLATTDNDVWLQEWEQWIYGNDGTTPKLLGSPLLKNAVGSIAGTSVHYGDCHAVANFDSSDTAITTVLGTSDTTGSTAGSSIGNISTNTATLTHPIARNNSTTNTVARRVYGCNASADVATATEQLYATVFPVNATTMSIFTADTATPSADGFDDDGRLEVAFFILPPPSIVLSMNSNNVEVIIGHDATDNVRHLVQVWIEEDPLHGPLA
jgi:hypothetical protein